MLTKIHQWFLWVPHKFHWSFVLLTGVLIPFLTRNHSDEMQRGEWYPFSNFPMYSTFEDTAYYVYVTDLDDKPLALVPTFGKTGSEVKKLYNLLLKAEIKRLQAEATAWRKVPQTHLPDGGSECRPAGDAALTQIRDTASDQTQAHTHSGLRLYQTDITLQNGNIVQRPKLVGEVRL